jgi:hypothetical protein
MGAKMYIINKFESATYVTRIFYFGPLSFNSTLPLKKPCNCVLIWAQKGSIVQRKKNLRIKLKISNKSLLQSTIIDERVNRDFMHSENVICFIFLLSSYLTYALLRVINLFSKKIPNMHVILMCFLY